MRSVEQIKQAIRTAEGPYHADGIYYANPDDADRQQLYLAQRIHRYESREILAPSSVCAWCGGTFTVRKAEPAYGVFCSRSCMMTELECGTGQEFARKSA